MYHQAIGHILDIADLDVYTHIHTHTYIHTYINTHVYIHTHMYHQAIGHILDIADLDVYTTHYCKEPNFGVARKLKVEILKSPLCSDCIWYIE